MPWTFSHPAAILPLRRFCPRWMNLAALVIGALTPDLGYYLGLRDVGIYAHSFAGSLFVCIPAGLAMLACFYLFRKPLCHLLPEPHRSALSPLTQSPLPLTAGAFIATIPSIAAGTWSHIVWDAFTHQSGWVVAR